MATKLYRYIPFETFIDIVINTKLTLLSPSLWEDSYEGWFWKVFKDSPKAGQAATMMLDSVFAQCWSKNGDSVALWSIYSYGNKAIAIETTKEYFEKLPKIICKDMVYSKDASAEIDDIVAMITNPCVNTLLFPYTKKRSDFLHENEVRIFAVVKENTNNQKSIDVTLPDLQSFITNVIVHPFASEHYVKIVESVCQKYNLPFGGRSRLYDLDGGEEQ